MSADKRKSDHKPPRRARGSLNKDEIIGAAISLIENEGVDSFSMPNLARSLNAGAMSIYRYFHNKDELLGALADRTLVDVYSRLPPASDGSWEEESVALPTALHRELLSVPLYLHLCRAHRTALVIRPDVIPAIATRLEAELEVFHRDGLPLLEAIRFLSAISAFTQGFSLMQLGGNEESGDRTPEEAIESSVNQMSETQFPTLQALSDVGSVISVGDEQFDRCLRLLIAGMRTEFEQLEPRVT